MSATPDDFAGYLVEKIMPQIAGRANMNSVLRKHYSHIPVQTYNALYSTIYGVLRDEGLADIPHPHGSRKDYITDHVSALITQARAKDR